MDSTSLELETCSKDGDAKKCSKDEKSSKENDRLIKSKNENETNNTNSKDVDTTKSSKFNDRQMRGRLAVDEKDRCSFFVHRKKRTCRMMVKPGKRFCGEHATQEVGDEQHQQQTTEASGK